MTRYLLAILLAASLPLTAQSQPGKPAETVCLTIPQRQRLADSLAVLPVVREAGQQFRRSADAYAGALVAQQRLTTDQAAQAQQWKQRARKRGFLNWVMAGVLAGSAYLYLQP